MRAKLSQLQANYRPGNRVRRCGLCSMFREPSRCTLVHGPIEQADLCDYFKPAKDREQR
jgi:hypothetical protein